jgi:hypothetical protein
MITNLFSKRQAKLRGEVPDVFTYDKIPYKLRVQIIYIWDDTLGNATAYNNYSNVQKEYKRIVEILCREHAVSSLVPIDHYTRNYRSELGDYLLREQDTEKVLDAIELSFKAINKYTRTWDYRNRHDNASKDADAASRS